MKRFGVLVLGVIVIALGLYLIVRPQRFESPYMPTLDILPTPHRISFKTDDGVEIVGDLYQSRQSNNSAVLYLHMMPAARGSWQTLAARAADAGFSGLAIDLRGHGESVRQNGKTLDYKRFSDQEQQAKRLDVDAALAWLEAKGFAKYKIAVVGASIGANLVLDALARFPEIKKVVALSPGLDYRGVLTEPAVKSIRPDQRALLVAADDDPESAQSVRKLASFAMPGVETKIFPSGGHGTNLFNSLPGLIAEIISWLDH